MVRQSKQGERRSTSPHRPRPPAVKTGPRKQISFRAHPNSLEGEIAAQAFIPKIK